MQALMTQTSALNNLQNQLSRFSLQLYLHPSLTDTLAVQTGKQRLGTVAADWEHEQASVESNCDVI